MKLWNEVTRLQKIDSKFDGQVKYVYDVHNLLLLPDNLREENRSIKYYHIGLIIFVSDCCLEIEWREGVKREKEGDRERERERETVAERGRASE